MATRRALCAQESRDRGEPLTATASRVDHWLLVEYHGAWRRDPVARSHLPEEVKLHLAGQAATLPHTKLLFIRRRDRPSESRFQVYVASSAERDPWLVGLELERPGDLLELDVTRGRSLGTVEEEPLLLVCTHGKRDRCCAAFGRVLYDDLRGRDEAVDRVWQSTHVGGDRFAGNVVCLPDGLYFGRVGPHQVQPLLRHLRAGEILLEAYRGRCSYGFPVQAAESEIRRATGIVGIADLRLESWERTGAGWQVTFRGPGGDLHTAEVRRHEGEPAYLTCSATTPRRPPRYLVR